MIEFLANLTLFQQEIIHLSLSLLAGVIVYYFYPKKSVFLFALLSGFFIDADHWIDDWLAYGANLNLASFFSGDYFFTNKKLIVIFHGWEYVAILGGLGIWFKKYRFIFFALALSLFFHLSFDVISNVVPIIKYSIVYRLINGFKIFPL